MRSRSLRTNSLGQGATGPRRCDPGATSRSDRGRSSAKRVRAWRTWVLALANLALGRLAGSPSGCSTSASPSAGLWRSLGPRVSIAEGAIKVHALTGGLSYPERGRIVRTLTGQSPWKRGLVSRLASSWWVRPRSRTHRISPATRPSSQMHWARPPVSEGSFWSSERGCAPTGLVASHAGRGPRVSVLPVASRAGVG